MFNKSIKEGGQADPKKNKYVILALLCLPFVLCLFFIFGTGSSNQAPSTSGGFNMTIPDGQMQKIEGDKQKAMAKAEASELQNARVRTLAESAFSLTGDTVQAPKREQSEPDRIAQSRNTFRSLTREMNAFYSPPRTDPQVEALKKQIAELTAELGNSREKRDPLDYMERSYALASKYLGAQSQQSTQAGPTPSKAKDPAV